MDPGLRPAGGRQDASQGYDVLPALVAHADWGKDPRKRWCAVARRRGDGYLAEAACRVGDAGTWLHRLRAVQAAGPVLVGFDFPIGLPSEYARLAAATSFRELLPKLGAGEWSEFYEVARLPQEVSVRRPFYPAGVVGVSREQLWRGLGLGEPAGLWRRCERGDGSRPDACPLFWTLGGNQVGRAAISGWRDVLGPATRSMGSDLAVWPFDGTLAECLRAGRLTVVETYPAEFYRHLRVRFPASKSGIKSGKRVQSDRSANADALIQWATTAGVTLSDPLLAEIRDGFGNSADGEDRFDAVIGLFGMLNVLLGHRAAGEPDDSTTRAIEGWILGQVSPAARRP